MQSGAITAFLDIQLFYKQAKTNKNKKQNNDSDINIMNKHIAPKHQHRSCTTS